jgi:hypothetical protein
MLVQWVRQHKLKHTLINILHKCVKCSSHFNFLSHITPNSLTDFCSLISVSGIFTFNSPSLCCLDLKWTNCVLSAFSRSPFILNQYSYSSIVVYVFIFMLFNVSLLLMPWYHLQTLPT